MKLCVVGAELFQADGQTDGQIDVSTDGRTERRTDIRTDRQTDITKRRVTFRNSRTRLKTKHY
jgi:hypothetical protein